MAEPQIIALGGLGTEAEDARLYDYVLGLAGGTRVLFLPTATGDDADAIVLFYERFAARAEASHLPLFPWPPPDLRELVLSQDVIWVSGGNTANMLALWRVHGLDRILHEAWEQGIVLAGWSAGMVCWFEAGVTDSFGPQLEPLQDGLGFLAGSACPHYDGEERRRLVYRKLVADGFPPGYAADDCVAVHFVGTERTEVVTARPTARAYRVERHNGSAAEEPIDPAPLP